MFNLLDEILRRLTPTDPYHVCLEPLSRIADDCVHKPQTEDGDAFVADIVKLVAHRVQFSDDRVEEILYWLAREMRPCSSEAAIGLCATEGWHTLTNLRRAPRDCQDLGVLAQTILGEAIEEIGRRAIYFAQDVYAAEFAAGAS